MKRVWITEIKMKKYKVLIDVLNGSINLKITSLFGLSYINYFH